MFKRASLLYLALASTSFLIASSEYSIAQEFPAGGFSEGFERSQNARVRRLEIEALENQIELQERQLQGDYTESEESAAAQERCELEHQRRKADAIESMKEIAALVDDGVLTAVGLVEMMSSQYDLLDAAKTACLAASEMSPEEILEAVSVLEADSE